MLKGLYIDSWVGGVRDEKIPSGAVNLVNNKDFDLREVDGLGRPDAEMYTQDKVSVDASFYSGQTIKSRTITLTVKTRNDFCRMQLYHMLGYGDKRCIFVETDAGTFWIEGYVKGASYTAKPAERQEIEISIFCPYPWFQSAQYHEQPITYGGGSVSVSQNGDVCAGVEMYLPSTFVGVLAQFGLSSSDGTGFEYGSDEYQHLNGGSNSPVLLADTTPGNHRFLAKKAIRDIALTNGWCTVPTAGKAVALTATIATVSGLSFDTTADGFLRWHDTFTGI